MLRTSYKISDSLARALGAVYKRAWRQWVYAGLAVVGSIIGQRWGIAGLAGGVLVALFVNYLLMAQLSLRLLGMSWGQFASAHGPGVRAAAVLVPAVWLAAQGTRSIDGLPSIVTLGVAGATGMAIVVALYMASPARLLGDDSQWLLERVQGMVARRLRRFRGTPHPA
jgi:PST family polysaccharide transporter